MPQQGSACCYPGSAVAASQKLHTVHCPPSKNVRPQGHKAKATIPRVGIHAFLRHTGTPTSQIILWTLPLISQCCTPLDEICSVFSRQQARELGMVQHS